MKRCAFVLCCLTLICTFNPTSCDGDVPNIFNYVFNQKYRTVDCINNILTKYFPCGTLTSFVNPNTEVDKLMKLVNGENLCHSIIVRSFDDRNWFVWTNVYVITAEDLLEFWAGMLDLTKDVFWNPRAKFIIQIENIQDDGEVIQEIFKTTLKYRMYNVVVLRNEKQDAVIYTYYPFKNHSCGKKFDEVVTLGTCEKSKDIIEYFPNKVPDRMKNCTVKVVGADDVPNFISKSSNYTVYGKYVSGLEQFVLDTMAAREGFVIDYIIYGENETYGIVLPNRTATGLLNLIDRSKADIAAGGYVLMQNRVELFDYLWGFNYAAYYLYTPAVGNQIWQRVYKEFGFPTWLLIAASFILMVTICTIMKKNYSDSTFSILNVWGYFFGNAGKGLSRNKKFRMITLWWAWFTFFIGSFYNTALYSLISVHVHETPHSLSVNNLKTLPYEPCISYNSRLFFQFAYNQKLPKGKLIRNCSYTDGSLQYVASTKKYYAIEMEYSYKLKEYKYINSVGKPELDSWIFSSTNVIVMYLTRGFPFIEKFQDYAHRLYESGLLMNHLKTLSLKSYSFIQRHPKPFSATTLLDLKMHFYVLFVGYILSFTCLLMEIFYTYVKEERELKGRVKKIYIN